MYAAQSCFTCVGTERVAQADRARTNVESPLGVGRATGPDTLTAAMLSQLPSMRRQEWQCLELRISSGLQDCPWLDLFLLLCDQLQLLRPSHVDHEAGTGSVRGLAEHARGDPTGRHSDPGPAMPAHVEAVRQPARRDGDRTNRAGTPRLPELPDSVQTLTLACHGPRRWAPATIKVENSCRAFKDSQLVCVVHSGRKHGVMAAAHALRCTSVMFDSRWAQGRSPVQAATHASVPPMQAPASRTTVCAPVAAQRAEAPGVQCTQAAVETCRPAGMCEQHLTCHTCLRCGHHGQLPTCVCGFDLLNRAHALILSRKYRHCRRA